MASHGDCLHNYAQSRKRFLTIKLYKSANADIDVDSSRHAVTSLTRLDRSIASFAAMERKFSKTEPIGTSVRSACHQHADAFGCFYMLPNVFFSKYLRKLNCKAFASNIETQKQLYVTWGMYHAYQRHFNRKNKCFIRAPRHWQALIKRMNGQVIESV